MNAAEVKKRELGVRESETLEHAAGVGWLYSAKNDPPQKRRVILPSYFTQ